MLENLLYIVIAFFLVLLNGFFVLAEFAIVKVRSTRMFELSDKGSKKATLSISIVKKMDEYLSATQLGITISSLGLGWIGEPAFAGIIKSFLDIPEMWSDLTTHSISLVTAFIFITFMHIIIGELAPKSIAIRMPEKSMLFSSRPMNVFYKIFYLPLKALNVSSNFVLKLIGVDPVEGIDLSHSENEMRMIFNASLKKGNFSLSRLLMLENILDFASLTLKDVKVELNKVITLSANETWVQNFRKIRNSAHTRYPLTDPNQKLPIGILHFKDVGMNMAEGVKISDLKKIMRPSYIIREDTPLEKVLRTIYKTKKHMLVLINEHGDWTGIATLEDILEKLVGPIHDEFEKGKEYSLSDIIPGMLIEPNVGEKSVMDEINMLVDLLHDYDSSISRKELIDHFINKKNLNSFVVEKNILLLHMKSEDISKPVAGIVISKEGMYGKDLNGLVNILVVVVTPSPDDETHLNVIRRITTLLASHYIKNRILNATTVEDVQKIFYEADRSLPA